MDDRWMIDGIEMDISLVQEKIKSYSDHERVRFDRATEAVERLLRAADHHLELCNGCATTVVEDGFAIDLLQGKCRSSMLDVSTTNLPDGIYGDEVLVSLNPRTGKRSVCGVPSRTRMPQAPVLESGLAFGAHAGDAVPGFNLLGDTTEGPFVYFRNSAATTDITAITATSVLVNKLVDEAAAEVVDRNPPDCTAGFNCLIAQFDELFALPVDYGAFVPENHPALEPVWTAIHELGCVAPRTGAVYLADAVCAAFEAGGLAKMLALDGKVIVVDTNGDNSGCFARRGTRRHVGSPGAFIITYVSWGASRHVVELQLAILDPLIGGATVDDNGDDGNDGNVTNVRGMARLNDACAFDFILGPPRVGVNIKAYGMVNSHPCV